MKPARRRTGSCVALGLALLVAPGLSVWGIGLAVLWLATVVVLRWQKQATEAAATPRGTGTEDPDSAYLKRVEQGMKNLHR